MLSVAPAPASFIAPQATPGGAPPPLGPAFARWVQRQHARPWPLPGSGATLARWRGLADCGAADLALAKLVEGHADALAILAELEPAAPLPAHARCATWCAEPPDARLHVRPAGRRSGSGAQVVLNGRKAWCSGAEWMTHALVSGWNPAGEPVLALVDLDQPGVRITEAGWQAVGMARTRSVDVGFDDVPGVQVGAPDAYVRRPGFTHGAAGVAACWYGGACAIAGALREAIGRRDDPHADARLGMLDVALAQAGALLRDAARAIDARPADPCTVPVMRARLAVESVAEQVLLGAPRALGAGPLCKDAALAQRFADLPVYLRQSHAERDLARLGREIAAQEVDPWRL